jgi:hypothetical protein
MRWLLVTLLVGVLALVSGCATQPADETQEDGSAEETSGLDYAALGLATDPAVSSIDQSLILSGGPPKDGIPALTDPEFLTVEESSFGPASVGILVEIDGEQRYYPYPILVWHEIVNDRIGDTPIAVTF